MSKVIVLFLLCFVGISCSLTVDLQTQMLKDEFGRSMFFHGVNVVNKIFPFYPNT